MSHIEAAHKRGARIRTANQRLAALGKDARQRTDIILCAPDRPRIEGGPSLRRKAGQDFGAAGAGETSTTTAQPSDLDAGGQERTIEALQTALTAHGLMLVEMSHEIWKLRRKVKRLQKKMDLHGI